jgi:C4-dicarboxylate transporter DctQ subunit
MIQILRWIDHLSQKLERGFLGGAIIFSSLLLFINVIMRYVFLYPIYWAEELCRYLMVWMIFIGASQVTLQGGHVAVDIVPRLLPKRANLVLAFLVNGISILFCLVLAYFAYRQMMRVKIAHQISPAMELPMWVAYLAIPLGTGLMSIRYVQQMILRARGRVFTAEETLD